MHCIQIAHCLVYTSYCGTTVSLHVYSIFLITLYTAFSFIISYLEAKFKVSTWFIDPLKACMRLWRSKCSEGTNSGPRVSKEHRDHWTRPFTSLEYTTKTCMVDHWTLTCVSLWKTFRSLWKICRPLWEIETSEWPITSQCLLQVLFYIMYCMHNYNIVHLHGNINSRMIADDWLNLQQTSKHTKLLLFAACMVVEIVGMQSACMLCTVAQSYNYYGLNDCICI